MAETMIDRRNQSVSQRYTPWMTATHRLSAGQPPLPIDGRGSMSLRPNNGGIGGTAGTAPSLSDCDGPYVCLRRDGRIAVEGLDWYDRAADRLRTTYVVGSADEIADWAETVLIPHQAQREIAGLVERIRVAVAELRRWDHVMGFADA